MVKPIHTLMRFFLSTFVIILVIGSFADLFAQRSNRQKIGLVDTDYILNQLPEYKGLDQTLNQMTIQWQQEIQEEEKNLNELVNDFEAKEILYTEEVIKQKQQEITAQEKKIAQLKNQRFGPKGDYFKEQQRLLEPIQRRIFETIEIVAKRDDFDFIFDRSSQMMVLFARPEWDVTDLILIELGIDLEEQRN